MRAQQKPFDIHGWNYESAKDGIGLWKPSLWYDLDLYGGKAFGLKLCEGLSRGSRYLTVPRWFSISSVNDYVFDQGQTGLTSFLFDCDGYVIIRSSGPEEDWIDPRSGVDVSEMPWGKLIIPRLKEFIDAGKQVVVQKRVSGVGFVVDIAFSEIFQKPVARIAHGNPSNEGGGIRYTSATWDHEARIGVYDAVTTEPIIPLNGWEGSIAPSLIHELVSSLERHHITFGVQLELVIHPMFPDTWHLVQLRPSPGSLCGMMSPPLTNDELITTTGKVNKAGVVEAELVAHTKRTSTDTVNTHVFAEIGKDGVHEWARESQERFAGKIVIWGTHQENPWSSHYDGPMVVLGMGRVGAVGQIAHGPLFPNSAHGTSLPYKDRYKDAYEEARTTGLLMSIDSDAQYTLERRAEKSGQQVLMVSDGIVGQVYLIHP